MPVDSGESILLQGWAVTGVLTAAEQLIITQGYSTVIAEGPGEDNIFYVPAEDRVFAVLGEDRVYVVEAEDRDRKE